MIQKDLKVITENKKIGLELINLLEEIVGSRVLIVTFHPYTMKTWIINSKLFQLLLPCQEIFKVSLRCLCFWDF